MVVGLVVGVALVVLQSDQVELKFEHQPRLGHVAHKLQSDQVELKWMVPVVSVVAMMWLQSDQVELKFYHGVRLGLFTLGFNRTRWN